MFAFVGIQDTSYRMKCLLCLPRETEIMAFQNSPSNLKKHIQEWTTSRSRSRILPCQEKPPDPAHLMRETSSLR
ncbi:unnamed protein product [Pleuronectes platessa]|uniref:Uncharacterized protein n=1 Tax=Pleuronectes platessa TaxID=8262 RepID=A0A9N7VDJ5_PLEPL|nr:unnamed protein product [Pleuronectes platessa]